MTPEAASSLSIQGEWPADGLEILSRCPVCTSVHREAMYTGLRDIVFGIAPGGWNLHRCLDCSCAYLDPRPNLATIAVAYRCYFTHAGTRHQPIGRLSLRQRWARALANGYRNGYYGTRETPAHWLGAFAGHISPAVRRRIKRSFRCLQPEDQGKRVLDVGCGGGNFLYWARAMGCRVSGTDPDPVVVANARDMGFRVRQGGIEAFCDEQDGFDIITMGHVIEHLHDPIATLRIAHRLLRANGRLWLETPNLDSRYHNKYKYLWRGLDSPRHLVLFNEKSVRLALWRTGYSTHMEDLDCDREILRTTKHINDIRLRAKTLPQRVKPTCSPFVQTGERRSDVIQLLATKKE